MAGRPSVAAVRPEPVAVGPARRVFLPVRWVVRPAVLVSVLAACGGPESDRDPIPVLDGEALGTRWTARVRGGAPDADPAEIRRAIEAELDAVDRAMSNWRPDSEISRLNRTEDPGPFQLSEPLALVLETALRVHEDSGGAFDVTVGPLLRLFGFGPGGDPEAPPPDPGAVAAARSRVGSGLLSVERLPDGRAVLHRSAPGVEADLSGIAKGYAVDRVFGALGELGYAERLVEVGGEIRAAGNWTVGVEDPAAGLAPRVHRSFPVRDRAVATSGGYRDFRTARSGTDAPGADDPRFWTHILDPRTGWPVERRTGSVTVLADSCLEADAWATALFVLGPAAGRDLAEERGLAALFLTAQPDGAVAEQATGAFAASTAGAEPPTGRMGR